jgi:uncharacterized repeat protein (TIGR01451 family)
MGPLESGVKGVTVNLYYDANNDGAITGAELTTPVAMTVTDSLGNYIFDSIPSGNYQVGITPTTEAPNSSAPTLTADGVDGNDNGSQPGGSGTPILSNVFNLTGDSETTTEPNQGGAQDGTAGAPDNDGDMTIDFGLVPNHSIGSTVFNDNNNNGIQDAIDLGISAVGIQLLYDNDNNPSTPMVLAASTTTDSIGNYIFTNLPAGNYMVVIPTVPSSAPTSSALDNVGGETDTDSNDNGTQPGGVGTAVSSGIITLTNMGEATSAETGQGGLQDSTSAAPDNQGDMTVDFGFVPYTSVGSNVFVDSDNNGVDDGTANEPGIAGVTVQVFDAATNALVGTAITDSMGNWLVDSLLPGDYYAVIATPSAQYPTSSTLDNVGGTDGVDNNDNGVQATSGASVTTPVFTLTGNGEGVNATEPGSGGTQDDANDANGDMSIDFGFVPYFSLGNQVWIDDAAGVNSTDYNGIKDSAEVGINGVTVQLYNATTGDLVKTEVTTTVGGNQGMYLFDSLLPGNYIVVIPANQLAPGGPLKDFLSSTGTFNAGGAYEVSAGIDPDVNVADNDDNGTFNTNATYPLAVVSQPITLGGAPEPTGENPDNDVNTSDINENLTVDFGFIPKVYDLALTKSFVDNTAIYVFGNTIPMNITVVNQGNTPVINVNVKDYVPASLTNVGATNTGWTFAGNMGTYVLAGPLNPGQTIIVPLNMVFQAPTAGTGGVADFVNYAEISDFTGGDGQALTASSGSIVDVDSKPDAINGNDAGGNFGLPGSAGGTDNTINNENGDEDDHDPLLLGFVDLALTKVLSNPGQVYQPNSNVEFTIKVTNQGSIPIDQVMITDYIPTGFTLNDTDWTAGTLGSTGKSASITAPVPGGALLQFGQSMDINITLKIDSSFEGYELINVAEISGAKVNGNEIAFLDIDSDADTNSTNDAGGAATTQTVVSPSDNAINGNGTGTPGSTVAATDEDDSDPSWVKVYQGLNDYFPQDPCSCKNDQTANGSGDGSFDETVSVAITNASETWTIMQVGPLLPGGVQPTGINVGSVMTFDAANNRHIIQFTHFDGSGYELFMEGPFAPGDPRNVKIREFSACSYSTLAPIQQIFACDSTDKIDLLALMVEIKNRPGLKVVTLNGQPITELDPNNLPAGYSKLKFEFTGTPEANLQNGTIENPRFPGCATSLEMTIFGGGLSISCNSKVNVSIDSSCKAVITPGAILEGEQFDGLGYNVSLKVNGVLLSNNILTSEHIGKPIVVSVVDPCNGNSCWGTINLEDKLPPVVICPTLPDIICTDSVKFPELEYSDCSTVKVTYADVKSGDDCTGIIIKRTWNLVDAYGNVGTNCMQTIKMLPVNINSIMMPTNQVNINACANIGTSPISLDSISVVALTDVMPYVLVNGVPRGVQSNLCNIYVNFKDVLIPVPCGKKIIRTWSILDWCTQTRKEFIQLIKISDTERPVVTAPSNFTVEASPWTCAAEFVMPAGTVSDNCDSNPTIRINGPLGVGVNGRNVTGLKLGTHTFTYIATDNCGNESIGKIVTVTVVDKSGPVAVAKEFIVINLTSDGTGNAAGKLFASNVDAGSFDMCGPVTLKVRRAIKSCDTLNTEYRDFVKFCCEDIGTHDVMLQVCDAAGNCNITWSKVRVESKIPVVINCPNDVTVNCDADLKLSEVVKSLSANESLPQGRANGQGLCENITVSYLDKLTNGQCGPIKVERTFTAVGFTTAKCVQTITIDYKTAFSLGNVTDSLINVNTCEISKDDFGPNGSLAKYKPTIFKSSCDVIGENIEIRLFDIEEGICKKWLVTFNYMNWCTGQQLSKEIKVAYVDNTDPSILCDDAMFEANATSNGCEGRVVLKTKGSDDNLCTTEGWLKWDIQIDINGDGTIDRTYSSSLLSTDPNYIMPTTPGSEVTVPSFDVANSMNTHKVFWRVTDGCGNYGTCNTTFMVVDKKAPTPYCVGLSTAVMKNGQVEVWAKDFDKGSYDNCSPSADLLFTFNNESPVATKLGVTHFFKGNGVEATETEYNAGNAQKWVPSAKSSGKVFDCDDVKLAQPLTVKMTVWDLKGNRDFCEVGLTLVDHQGGCPGMARMTIEGSVKTEKEEGIKNTEMKLSSVMDPQVDMSKADGNYTFNNLPANIDYELRGVKRDDWLNGVSTLDLVHIQRHILGISRLNNPYKLIAADVNNDSKVTASDLVSLRKAILGVSESFPNNNSWRYLDKSTPIVDANSPWPLDEVIEIKAGSTLMKNQDFMGVKVGDVNNSAIASSAIGVAEPRSSNAVKLAIDDREVVAGEEIELSVKANDFNNVHGFQFTLNTKMTIASMSTGSIEINGNNYGVLSDKVTMSWSSDKAITAKGRDEVLFTIKATANKAGRLSDMISLTSDITKAESYTNEGMEPSKIELIYNKQAQEASYELYQNEPNPFKNTTVVSYNMPAAAKAKFTLKDVTGKLVYTREVDAVKGMNSIEFNRSEIPTTGVIFYTIDSGSFTATKAMIVIE